MRIEVEKIVPWKIGGDLYRIILQIKDSKGNLIQNYEVWTLLSAVQYKLKIDTFPNHMELARFGIEFLKKRIAQTNHDLKEKGAYYSEKGVTIGDPATFPDSLGNVEQMLQTNIILPVALHQWAKIESAKTNLSFSELVRLGLQDMRQKGEFRENFQALFDIHIELHNIADSIFDTEHKTKGNGFKSLFLGYALAKAYKTQEAILTLCQRGYGEDAAQLVRTLFDLSISTAYIFKDQTDNRVTRYLDFGWILKEKMYEHILTKPEIKAELEKREKEARPGDVTTKMVFEEAKKAQEKYKYTSPYHWSDKSLRGMAEEVGRLDAYNTVYRLLSQFEHSSVTTMNDYMSVNDHGFIADVVLDSNWISECLVISFDFYYFILRQYNEYQELGLDDALQKIEDKYVLSVGKV